MLVKIEDACDVSTFINTNNIVAFHHSNLDPNLAKGVYVNEIKDCIIVDNILYPKNYNGKMNIHISMINGKEYSVSFTDLSEFIDIIKKCIGGEYA